MKEESLRAIELEMAILARRITTIALNRKDESLVRSAYLLLHQISTKGPAGVKDLAEELQLDISTVSRQAASLEQKGYVKKIQSPSDRRSYFFELTQSGETEMKQYRNIRREKVANLLNDWTDEEREQFGKLLSKFNEAMKGVK
ncbi:MarR family winged helix-turn-helix transcriptional regulator [Jeotgalibacillus aurantiacus]|uniref:MarR family winged helix-turn-helix transcriptional regulator n=1 Tax=Jeotgalibacillus aurantiacus TaxID=2763266 RepID=UPI001D0BB25C|nr:MarR family transcriptional regulator [Jeotgalibacillus aurantiacus]